MAIRFAIILKDKLLGRYFWHACALAGQEASGAVLMGRHEFITDLESVVMMTSASLSRFASATRRATHPFVSAERAALCSGVV